MKKKTGAILLGAAIVAFALATWASPHWQLYRMRAAVEARDAQALARHVDFPKLRESVKVQIARRMGSDSPYAQERKNPFAAFGRAMALAVIDPVVDAAVSPAGVAAMLDAGEVRVQPRTDDPPAAAGEPPREKPNYDLSYRSWDEVVVERADGGGVRFLLDRHGLWSWKLAGVELREE